MTNEKITATTDFPESPQIEKIISRVKKDLVWVLVSAVVAIGTGLAAGQLM